MIPILFKENESNFNSNGIGFLNETINYEVTEERNGAFELVLEYPVSGKWFKELKDFRLIMAKPNDTDEDHLFRIYEIVKDLSSQMVTIYASSRSNDLGGNLIRHVVVENETPQQALTKMKSNLIQPTDYQFVSDIQTKSSTEWLRRNPLNCIAGEEGSLVNYWGGEIKRTNSTIYLYSRRGKDRVTTIRQGKNLEGFELTSSTKGMITRILPFFTYTPEGRDTPVTITGTIVDSPLVNNYPVKYITPVDYSSDDTIDTLAKLNAAAKSYFAYQNPDCDKPSVNMQIDLLQLSDSSEYAKFKDLEHIGLTDTVMVWVEKFDVDVEVKINELTYSGALDQVTNIVAGSTPHTLYDDVKKDYKNDYSHLEQHVNTVENGIRNTIQLAADGKSTIFRGYTEPDITISRPNDLWFKELGDGEVEIYIFDGAYWQPYVTAGLNEAVKAEVRAILAQAEEDRVKAEADFDQAVIDAEAYTEQKAKEFDAKLVIVNQEITSVKNSADQSVIKADQAIKDAGFAQVDASAAKVSATNALSAASTAKTDASSALTKANAAVTDASKALSAASTAKTDASSALTKANTAITDSSKALVNASTAITDSGKALTNANTAITDSSEALANANTALTRVGAVEVTTGSLTTSYDSLTKTVALKADKTIVDGINGKVTTQGLAITANATAIGLKADKTLVDTLSGTVSKHTTDIKATSDGLALKADSSIVNTIKGTVTTHTTQIKATSDGLALKADKTLVDTLSGTVSKHTTDIKATAEGLLLKADSSIVNTIKGTVDTHTTKIKATSDGLALKADSSLVNTIKGTVDTHTTQIKTTSDGLALKADKTLVDTLSGTVSKHTTDIKATSDGLALKANSSVVTALSGTVSKHTTDIKATSDGLALKADSKLVNTINGTVATHTTQIKTTSDGLALKADSKLVNTINGTVATHTTQIAANSQAITARLTSAQVETILTGKKYVNETTLSATSKGLTAQITQVSNLVNNIGVWSKSYNVNTATTMPLTNPDGSALDDWKSYEVQGQTTGTGSVTSAIAVFKSKRPSGGGWELIVISEMGVNSNHPDFCINTEGQPSIRLKGHATKYNVAVTHTAYDGRYTPLLDSELKYTTINATINGIQTTVAAKADKTQITQLSNQISTKVESATYNSKMTQLDQSINLRVVAGDVTAAILADKSIKDTRSDNQAPSWYLNNYPRQIVKEFKVRKSMGLPGSQYYSLVTTEVPYPTFDSGNISIVQTAESKDGTFKRSSNTTATWTAWEKTAEVGNLVAQINLSPKGVLIQGKNIQLDGDVVMNAAFITRLDTQTLNAVTANIATIRTKMLTTDVILSTMIKSDTALITKLFATDANVSILTAKTAFINSVKAIDISAARVTTGTLNAAKVTIINLDASKITTGTVNGTNSSWNLNTGTMQFKNPTNGDILYFDQGQISFNNGAQSRYLMYNSEGLQLVPGGGNTGTSKNTALHLIGGGTGSYQYIQFASNASGGINQRVEAEGQNLTMYHGKTGSLIVAKYGESSNSGLVISGAYETRHSSGVSLRIAGDSISTPRDGARNIYLVPQGVGSVVSGNASGVRYTMVASDFVKQSSRYTKTNIVPIQEGLSVINELTPVTYNKIDKLNMGIYEIEKGFISEDSLSVATPDGKGIYDSHITAHLVKGMQELSQSNTNQGYMLTEHEQRLIKLEEENKELREKIEQMESAA